MNVFVIHFCFLRVKVFMSTPSTPLATSETLDRYCRSLAHRARAASIELAGFSSESKAVCLRNMAASIRVSTPLILKANALDIVAASSLGLSPASIDRLRLNHERVEQIAAGVEAVATLDDFVGEVLECSTQPSGLEVRKIRVPLGVVFFIYESRPNVTADAAAVAIASGNAIILRGGKEAAHSSTAIVAAIREAIIASGLPLDCVQLVDTPDRVVVGLLLAMDTLIDIVIPRGGEDLVRRVCSEARMPVLKHFRGNCHVYVDRAADIEMARSITINAKCQRMGVCNAAESLLVHRDVADAFLPMIGQELKVHGVAIVADAATCKVLPFATLATDADFATEFLGPKISVAVVDSLDAAIEHVNRYGSRHTDAIVTSDSKAADRFASRVDTAVVMINASTRFNDGGEMGLGAEIGISTDKLHARGPCGPRELTTYKYIVTGNGQTRS